jgi:hypothetical protein
LLPVRADCVGGVEDLEHRASVFAGHQRGAVFAHALDEVPQFLRVALVERFLERR